MEYLFDENNLTEFLSHFDEAKRERMVSIYIKGLQAQKEACTDALNKQDAEALQNTAHDLKSLAYMIGATDFGETAENTEKNIIENNIDDAFTAAKPLPDFIDHAVSVMEAHLSK